MGITVKQARLLSGLSQVEVADSLGVHRQTYAKWEKNADSMTIGQAKKFAEIAGVQLEQIFFTSKSTLGRQVTA